MAKNQSLSDAKKRQEDEFYTKIVDIERELKYYKNHFKDKVVFCNCDDPETSNFWKYFYMNFEHLSLKKLIATHYDMDSTTYKLEYDGRDVIQTLLYENGDFRSSECIDILRESDIVVTNPPFSLFRDYVALLVSEEVGFIIIGNQNTITYKEIFPLLQANKLWLGYNSGDMEFIVPSYYKPRKTRYREENGINYRSMGNICWYTNMDIDKRHESLTLYKEYNSVDYPEYDSYSAINVNKVAEIPVDYDGPMGVPITFANKYNPDQFEIIDANDFRKNSNVPVKPHGLIKDKDGCVEGERKYVRILIRRRVA